MRIVLLATLLALFLPLAAAPGVPASFAATADVSQPAGVTQPADDVAEMAAVIEADRIRIRAHLESVEERLRAAPVSHLTAAQRRARGENLDRLREYRLRGEFPHNHDLDHRAPYFRDRHGTLCAMAYLIAESGSSDLVDRVAEDANNAYIAELASDVELTEWLAANGMTASEAALVQPAYYAPERKPAPLESVLDGYTAWGILTLLVDGVALGVNDPANAPLLGDRALSGVLAVAAGTIGGTLGVFGTLGSRNTPDQVLGILNMGVGVVTVAVGVRSILREFSEGDQTAAAPDRASHGVRVRPMILDDRAGMRVSVDF